MILYGLLTFKSTDEELKKPLMSFSNVHTCANRENIDMVGSFQWRKLETVKQCSGGIFFSITKTHLNSIKTSQVVNKTVYCEYLQIYCSEIL